MAAVVIQSHEEVGQPLTHIRIAAKDGRMGMIIRKSSNTPSRERDVEE